MYGGGKERLLLLSFHAGAGEKETAPVTWSR